VKYRFEHNGQVYDVSVTRSGDSFQAAINGEVIAFEQLDAQPGQISLRFVSGSFTVYYAEDGAQRWVSLNGCTYRLDPPSSRRSRGHAGETSGGEHVRAPMPAQVRAVQVQEGDRVEKGQVLVLLEAMKMEIRVKSPGNGRLSKLLVKAGQAVEKEQLLAEIETGKE
jgi:3-methylcrotonyl-CoA carboxylase alpha subunit